MFYYWNCFMKRILTVTNILIVINVVIFLLEEMAWGSTNTEVAFKFWAMFTPILAAQPWRAFTAMFLHFWGTHLLMNMVSLYNIWPAIERIMWKWKYLIIYLVSWICGNLLVFGVESVTQDFSLWAGASWAIFWILWAWLAFVLFFSDKLKWKIDVRQVGASVFCALLPWFMPWISLTAHIGWLIWGFVMCYMFLIAKKLSNKKTI